MSNQPSDESLQLRPTIRIHPAAELFPLMGNTEFQEFVADIREKGVLDLMIFRGETLEDAELIDGRNRHKAILELGWDPFDYVKLVQPCDMPDPIGFVLSMNLHRRHLNTSQRAMVAVEIANMKKGRPELNASNEAFVSQPEAAKVLNIGRSSVQKAGSVCRKAVPAITAAVKQGELTVSAAAAVSDLPESEQQRLIDVGPKEVKAAASKRRFKPKKQASSSDTSLSPVGFHPAVFEASDLSSEVEELQAVPAHPRPAVEVSVSLQKQIVSLINSVNELAKGEDGAWISDKLSEIQMPLWQARIKLRQTTYACRCPKCKGIPNSSCTACVGRGYLDQVHYAELSDVDKKWVLDNDPSYVNKANKQSKAA